METFCKEDVEIAIYDDLLVKARDRSIDPEELSRECGEELGKGVISAEQRWYITNVLLQNR